ncbi:hypothetical protein OKW41_001167 [Paraburkholderia sp. UCT70]
MYAKRPFAGPEAVLAYLSRYTHRVAISSQRLLAFDERGVTFRWKDYRSKGRTRSMAMTLEAGELMRRFLLHVLPGGFHRIGHYGLLANPVRRANLAKVHELLQVAAEVNASPEDSVIETRPAFICRHCGASMIITDILARTAPIRAPPILPILRGGSRSTWLRSKGYLEGAAAIARLRIANRPIRPFVHVRACSSRLEPSHSTSVELGKALWQSDS